MELKIEYVPVGDLIPYENNTRRHAPDDIDQIKASIEADGFNDPIGVWNNIIVEGHGRLIAAKEIGLEKVPVIRLDHLTDTQRRDYAIRHNRTAELSAWDFGKLEEEIARLEIEGVDLSGLNFDFDSMDVVGTNADIKEDEPPEPPEEPRAKRGDIYQLGRHRLMCGDSTESTEVEKLMGGHTADIAITSPPYGESNSAKLRDHYERGKDKRKSLYQTHDDDIHGWIDLLNGAFANMQHYSVGQFVNIQMLADNKKDLISWLYANNESLVDIIIWDKTKAAPQMQSNVLNNQYEFLFVFCKDNPTRSIPYANFHGNVNNVIRLATGQNEFAHIHRAVYPVEFPASIMRIAENAENVLDLFGGTGTTLIASEQLGKSCYMMELDPHYVDVIIQRWENLTGEKAVKLN